MYRFIHLDNILSVALIDGEFHELEVKKCMQIAVTMGFLELEMELLMQKIKLAMETNGDGKNARSIVKSEICNLINQTHFHSWKVSFSSLGFSSYFQPFALPQKWCTPIFLSLRQLKCAVEKEVSNV